MVTRAPQTDWLARGLLLAACAAGLAGCFDFGSLKPKGDAGSGMDDGGDGDVVATCAEKTYACDGDELVTTCVDGSASPERETCTVGCADKGDGKAVCKALSPSFVTGANRDWAVLGTYELVVDDNVTLDTERGVLSGGSQDGAEVPHRTQPQEDGAPDLMVFALASLDVKENAKLTIIGPRAVAFVVRGDATIEGIIDVSADEAKGGPGGASGDVSDADLAAWPMNGEKGQVVVSDTEAVAFAYGGGGGGSNGAAGGIGGGGAASRYVALADSYFVATLPAGGASGKTFFGSPAVEGSLVGGGAGGPAVCGPTWPIRGGGGGGSILLSVSGALRMTAGAQIVAAGAGGRPRSDLPFAPAEPCSGFATAGAGGGAGGTILINAASVTTFDGGLFANGGGGAGGNTINDVDTAEPGQDGRASAVAAAGGDPAPPTDAQSFGKAVGGAGGAGGASPPAGQNGETVATVIRPESSHTASALGGGGGGGVGRIKIRVRTDSEVPSGATFSPSAGPAFVAEDSLVANDFFVPERP